MNPFELKVGNSRTSAAYSDRSITVTTSELLDAAFAQALENPMNWTKCVYLWGRSRGSANLQECYFDNLTFRWHDDKHPVFLWLAKRKFPDASDTDGPHRAMNILIDRTTNRAALYHSAAKSVRPYTGDESFLWEFWEKREEVWTQITEFPEGFSIDDEGTIRIPTLTIGTLTFPMNQPSWFEAVVNPRAVTAIGVLNNLLESDVAHPLTGLLHSKEGPVRAAGGAIRNRLLGLRAHLYESL